MAKNIIIAILILVIIALCGTYWFVYMREPVIDPPVETFVPTVIETPAVTEPPLLYIPAATPMPVYTPSPTVDPYWVPGPWGDYVYG